MANYTISGAANMPDGVTPLNGKWYVWIVSSQGVATDGDGSWRGGRQPVRTNPDTGACTVDLPQTTGSWYYAAQFVSLDKQTILGPYFFTLTANKTWESVIGSITAPALTTVLYLEGTGSPEGVVSAPVGSKYTDKNATNGAVEWIKRLGTGNTGWRVSYGNTGWRNVIVFDNTGAFSVGALGSSPWKPRTGFSGFVRYKRENSTVSVIIANVACNTPPNTAGADPIFTLASGFRPSYGSERVLSRILSAGGRESFAADVNSNGTVGRSSNQAMAPDDFLFNASLFFNTQDPWPSSLPGVAVGSV